MKLAAVPSCDMKFDAPNWFLTMIPIGFWSPVTKEIIAKSANIIAMGRT